MAEPGSLSFPDGPRTELDEAISSLVTQSERVMRAQGRLRDLLSANQAVMQHRELPLLLRSIVDAAIVLVGARYGALGVINPDRDALEHFLYSGLTEHDAAAIGRPPAGHGLLGALMTDARPIRLASIADDPRAAGFPANHPPMNSFLGVALRVNGDVFGNLYLTDQESGEFTEEDEQLLEALASTAGFAIENARLLADAQTRATWMTASAELSAGIGSTSSDAALDLIVDRVRDISGAAQVTILIPTADDRHFGVAAAIGSNQSLLRGATLDPPIAFAERVLEDAVAHSQVKRPASKADPLLITQDGVSGPALAISLRTLGRFWGVLCIARDPDSKPFSAAEIEGATELASRASSALELAKAGEDARSALVADSRRRIARDQHDDVIQQLFGAGLGLQLLGSRLGPGPDSDSLGEAIEQLDDAIGRIRTVMLALSQRDETTVRLRLLDVVGELSGSARQSPAVRFTGPVDLMVRDGVADDVVAVAHELLRNAIQHAHADRISLEVRAQDGMVCVVVEDDGVGLGDAASGAGLTDLRDRAEARSGQFGVDSSGSGTTFRWMAPTPSPPEIDARREQP